MLYNTAYNCLPVEAGLIKAEIPALDKINPSANSVQQAVLRAAVTTEQDFTANVYLLPAKSVAADCETCLRLYQKTFPAGKTNFDIDITDIFQQSSADAAYVRVAPVADAAFKLSGRVEITIEASRPTNAVTREQPTEARLGVDAGSLGSASVNLRDGSLSFSHADLALGGGKTAFSLIHTYHGVSYDTDEIFSGVSAKTGKGWKTNFHQFLAGSDKSASYVDAAGSEHFFDESGGKIYDTSGLGLWLEPTGQCKQLRDDNGNIMRFYPDGRLCGIKSAAGGGISVSYAAENEADSSAPARVTYIRSGAEKATFIYYNDIEGSVVSEGATDSLPFSEDGGNITFNETLAGDIVIGRESVPVSGVIAVGKISQINNGDAVASFAYENDLLSSVSYTGLDEQLRFFYDDGRLIKISKFIGETESVQARFEYTGGRLSRVCGDDYAELSISYDDDGRVTALSRSAGGAPQTTVEYGDGFAVVTDELGAKTRYVIDEKGDVTSIINVTDGCDEQLYPEQNSSANVIGSRTLVGGYDLGDISGVTVGGQTVSLTGGAFTLKDLRATLTNAAKNGTSFDFVYDKGRKKICGVSPSSCWLNTATASFALVSGGAPIAVTYETTVKDVTQINAVKITVTETFSADFVQSVTTASDAKTGTVYGDYTKTVKSRHDGKPLSVSENGVLTEYTYDAAGNLTQTKTKKDGGSSEQIVSSAVYDSATGGKTSETDANGFSTTYTYLMPHNLVSGVTSPFGTVTYSYDAFKENLASANGVSVTTAKGKIAALSKGALGYAMEYSPLGDLTSVKEGSTVITSRSAAYTGVGKTVTETRCGTAVTTAYNKYGRPASVSIGGKTATVQYADGTSKAKVSKITDNISGVTTTYSVSDYDEGAFTCTGALTWNKKAYIKNGKVYSAYNINGDGTEIVYSSVYSKEQFDRNGKIVSNVRVMTNYNGAYAAICQKEIDNLNRIAKVSTQAPKVSQSGVSYLKKTNNYKSLTNSTTHLIQKESIEYSTNSNPPKLQNAYRQYEYDSAGNVTKISTNNGSVTYTYTGGRLTRESNGLTGQNISYEYDTFGNITKKTVTGADAATHTYSYDSNWPDLLKKHYVNGIMQENVAYTACCPSSVNGNTVTWERGLLKTYETSVTDGDANVTTTNKHTYYYDAFGRRFKKAATLTTSRGGSAGTSNNVASPVFYYDGDKLIAQRTQQDSVDTSVYHFIYDDTGICAMRVKIATLDEDSMFSHDSNHYMFFHLDKDIFGSVVGIYSDNGKVLDISYDAFGKPHCKQVLEKNPGNIIWESVLFLFGYKGYYYDRESGLYFTGKEYYNPETGRYLVPQSVDNLGFETDGLNLFAYKHNRPLNVNEIKTATTSSTYNYTNSTDLDISQALLIGAGAIGNVLDIAGTALDFVQLLKNTKVFHNFTGVLTGISAGIELVENIVNGSDINTIVYSLINPFISYGSSYIGIAIGTAIGGLPGAIFGIIFSILLTTLFEDLLKQFFGI